MFTTNYLNIVNKGITGYAVAGGGYAPKITAYVKDSTGTSHTDIYGSYATGGTNYGITAGLYFVTAITLRSSLLITNVAQYPRPLYNVYKRTGELSEDDYAVGSTDLLQYVSIVTSNGITSLTVNNTSNEVIEFNTVAIAFACYNQAPTAAANTNMFVLMAEIDLGDIQLPPNTSRTFNITRMN